MVEGTGGKERILGFRRSSICSEESSSYCFRFLTTVDYQFSVGASRRFSKGIVGIRISFFFKIVIVSKEIEQKELFLLWFDMVWNFGMCHPRLREVALASSTPFHLNEFAR